MRWQKFAARGLGELLLSEIDKVALLRSKGGIVKFTTWSIDYVYGHERVIMARKKDTRTNSAPSSNARQKFDTRWLNIPLTAEDKLDVVALADSPDDFANALVGLLETGVNFTVRFESATSEYKCYVSDARGSDGGTGYSVSSRATLPRYAVSAAIIKLRIYQSNPAQFADTGDDLGIG
jgi:hypothetical protein